MSYIDTIKHELVGYLNGLPIYLPTENLPKSFWGNPDFSCGTSNLVIGGGSGEHPALVIHHLSALVCEYLLYNIEQFELFYSDGYQVPPDKAQNQLVDIALTTEPTLEFCGWSMQDQKKFIENAMSKVHFSPLVENGDAEKWIRLSIGEFVYFSLPSLNEQHAKIQKVVGEHFHWQVGYWMRNVTCPPPHYVTGKTEALQSSRQNGCFRWEYIDRTETVNFSVK